MKDDFAVGDVVGEGQGEDVLRGDVGQVELRAVAEAEAGVVVGIADEDAAVRAGGPQLPQPLADEGLADALALAGRQHGDGPEAVPAALPPLDADRGKGDMADHTPVNLGDQREGERVSRPQRENDELLRVLADGMVQKRGSGHLRDGRDVLGRLWADVHGGASCGNQPSSVMRFVICSRNMIHAIKPGCQIRSSMLMNGIT